MTACALTALHDAAGSLAHRRAPRTPRPSSCVQTPDEQFGWSIDRLGPFFRSWTAHMPHRGVSLYHHGVPTNGIIMACASARPVRSTRPVATAITRLREHPNTPAVGGRTSGVAHRDCHSQPGAPQEPKRWVGYENSKSTAEKVRGMVDTCQLAWSRRSLQRTPNQADCERVFGAAPVRGDEETPWSGARLGSIQRHWGQHVGGGGREDAIRRSVH